MDITSDDPGTAKNQDNFVVMCNDHQTPILHLFDLQVEFLFPEIKDDLFMVPDSSLIGNVICSAWNLDAFYYLNSHYYC